MGYKMLKINNVVCPSAEQWLMAIRGMRHPLQSYDRSDTTVKDNEISLGDNDLGLMKRLIHAGTEHRKFLRQLPVIMDITAPLLWWKEASTYKVGTASNSTSTMHKITSKPIELSDFSYDDFYIADEGISLKDCFINVVADCEMLRKKYLETKNEECWRGLIQLLPESYNQTRMWSANYEVLYSIYFQRENHKLTEWHDFCRMIRHLPYMDEFLFGGRYE